MAVRFSKYVCSNRKLAIGCINHDSIYITDLKE